MSEKTSAETIQEFDENTICTEEQLNNNEFSSDDLLQCINSVKNESMLNPTLHLAWFKLRDTLQPKSKEDEKNLDRLKLELTNSELSSEQDQRDGATEENPKNEPEWITDIFNNWINKDKKGVTHFARLAAIRMVGAIAGSNSEYSEAVSKRLWSIIKCEDYSVDARAYALYSLWYCNFELCYKSDDDKDYNTWENTFGANGNGYWLESIRESKIRSRAIEAVGNMAVNSSWAKCWKYGVEACEDKPDKYRLQDDKNLWISAERMLLDHWGNEIDYGVTSKLIEAIGCVSGWTDLPSGEQSPWPVIKVLEEAAKNPYFSTSGKVPGTIESIATNSIHSHEAANEKKEFALKQLLNFTVNKIEFLAIYCRDDDESWQDFEQQRRYLLTLRRIAEIAERDLEPPLDETIMAMAINSLLDIADGLPNSNLELKQKRCLKDAVKLRRLALFYLDELVQLNGHARQIVTENASKRYELMLADPNPDIAKEVAKNLINLKGQEEAACLFVDIIFDDGSLLLDRAMDYRLAHWPDEPNLSSERMQDEIRDLAADELGGIVNNSAAYSRLVEALRENNIRASRARDALIRIGGERAVESVIQYDLQRQVDERFFQPMEEARNQGWNLMNDVRNWADGNYRSTYRAANVAIYVGIIIVIFGVIFEFAYRVPNALEPVVETIVQPLNDAKEDSDSAMTMGLNNEVDTPDEAGSGPGVTATTEDQSEGERNSATEDKSEEEENQTPQVNNSFFGLNPTSAGIIFAGLMTSILGALGTAVFDPVKGLQKATAEITQLIMTFENYLGRMRLIGLGFAHAYTSQNWEQLDFLNQVSNLTASAMRESGSYLDKIGEWPGDSQFVNVPYLMNRQLDEAILLVQKSGLEVKVSDPKYDNGKTINTVIAQDPDPGISLAVGSLVKVTPSTNQQPMVVVPDFKGKKVLEAVQLAQNKGLDLTDFEFEISSDSDEGTVIKQKIPADMVISQGSQLTLTLAKKDIPGELQT